MTSAADAADSSLRLDRWLWCARLFKTRSQAAAAVTRGRVEVNGARAKPARALRPGDHVTIRRPPQQLEVEVRALSARRLSAPLARELYSETAASIAAREQQAAERALGGVVEEHRYGKLDKKARRQLSALKRGAAPGGAPR